jgi:hypothetical protein
MSDLGVVFDIDALGGGFYGDKPGVSLCGRYCLGTSLAALYAKAIRTRRSEEGDESSVSPSSAHSSM